MMEFEIKDNQHFINQQPVSKETYDSMKSEAKGKNEGDLKITFNTNQNQNSIIPSTVMEDGCEFEDVEIAYEKGELCEDCAQIVDLIIALGGMDLNHAFTILSGILDAERQFGAQLGQQFTYEQLGIDISKKSGKLEDLIPETAWIINFVDESEIED